MRDLAGNTSTISDLQVSMKRLYSVTDSLEDLTIQIEDRLLGFTRQDSPIPSNKSDNMQKTQSNKPSFIMSLDEIYNRAEVSERRLRSVLNGLVI